MDKFYQLEILGLKRELPVCKLYGNVYIAGFIMFSDIEMTTVCANELLNKSPDFDIILTAESKGIPLAYEMARQSGKNYVVARKGKKLYMQNPIQFNVKSITTAAEQTLYLDQSDLDKMNGKRVLLVDDVISTGASLMVLEKLLEQGNGILAGKAAVLAEGDAAKRNDIIFIKELPLLFEN